MDRIQIESKVRHEAFHTRSGMDRIQIQSKVRHQAVHVRTEFKFNLRIRSQSSFGAVLLAHPE